MLDESSFNGQGWSFPVGVSYRGGVALSSGLRDVEESIRLILGTPLGERRMRPQFGCAVHALAFATNDPTTHGLIRHYVLEALALWEPRIEVVEVRVAADPELPARLFVDIGFTLRATNQRRNLVYPFYLIPEDR
jgi:phage baseplate assembly protein W